MNTIITENKEKIIEYLVKKLDVILIIIFGSSTTDKIRPDSDIDIAFISENKLSSRDIFVAAQDLSSLLKRDIDLIDLTQVSPVMQAQIITSGKIIYDAQPQKRQEFFILALKTYARLNEERNVVVQKIKERGHIYG